MSEIVQRLATHPFFKQFDPLHLEWIAPCATMKTYEKDTYIIRDGEEAKEFFVVFEGKVALELHLQNRSPVVIQVIGSGGVVGWSWLFPPQKWHFHSRVIEPLNAITFDAECLLLRCEKNREFGYELMKGFSKVLYERLHATRQQFLDFSDLVK